jgi:hypothetical protein
MSSSFVFFIARPCFGMIFTLLYKKRKKRKREKNYNHPERQVVWLLRKRLSLFFGEKNPRFFCLFDSHKLLENRHLQKKKKKHSQEKNIYIEKR